MAKPSALNPLSYIIQRPYKDNLIVKNKLFHERFAKARNLYRKDLLAHYGCVNAIEFSAEGELLVSGGDDRRVLLWSVPEAIYDKGSPVVMRTTHHSNIFCVAFDSRNERIFSGGNDDQVLIHEIYSGNLITTIPHKKPVYGLSINPQNDDIVATAGDDGRLLLFDVRESPSQDGQVLAKQKTGFHSVMFNPTNPRFLVSANSEDGIALWDCRKPKEELIHYDNNSGKISGISACFDSMGKRVLALRRRLPPVLYETQSESSVCQFYHPQYYNSCTMKTCCFAGDNDEYILSGSDDFNLYMWKIPQDSGEWGTSHLVLRGHRSIVNQVRYNKHNNLIASSGVEKIVKLWSTIPIGTWRGSLLKEHSDPARTVYSHEDYVTLVGQSGERISHDYSDQSTLEDAKMMAFFDSLIQREIENWDSTSENLLTSDSDSEDQDHDWSKLISKMFRNGRHSNEEPKKHKYNKIAQLISKKRNHLAKMAHKKSPSSIQKYQQKEKSRKHKSSSKSKAHKHNGANKKISRKRSTDSESRRSKSETGSSRSCKYRTRQSIRDLCDSIRPNRSNSNLLDAPSTSTGITNSSNSLYRVIDQDSDEDALPINDCEVNGIVEEDNFVNILPTPLNGSHDMYINVLEVNNSNPNGSAVAVPNGSVVAVRNDDYVRASTSGGTMQSCESSSLKVYESGCASTSNTNASFMDDYNTEFASESDSDSDYEYDYHTPVKKRRTTSASDSGCATGPCSSSSVYSIRNIRNHQECSTNGSFNGHSSDEEYKFEKFRKRVKKARVNFRKHIGADSDSN